MSFVICILVLLKISRIKEVLPTNLPIVSANEKHMDNLFLLEDDTYAIVGYKFEEKRATASNI